MDYKFKRNDENQMLDVEINSTGLCGGDGGTHTIKIDNLSPLMFYLDEYAWNESNRIDSELTSITFRIHGDWEFGETIDALKYIVNCLEKIKEDYKK